MVRSLTQIEIDEARIIFNATIDYTRIKVHEGARWPDRLAGFSAWLQGAQPPTHNAVTLGNRLYFPVELRTLPDDEGVFSLDDMAWLVHELTHAWQYQNHGLSYLWQAIGAQIRHGHASYDYGWEQGLIEARLRGDALFDFNPEQQGDIARHYYYRHKQGLDTQAWDPFVLFFKSP